MKRERNDRRDAKTQAGGKRRFPHGSARKDSSNFRREAKDNSFHKHDSHEHERVTVEDREAARIGSDYGDRVIESRESSGSPSQFGEQVYGVSPVLEALRAGSRPIERIMIADGVHQSRLRELIDLARRQNIPIRRMPRPDLQRLAAGVNHQGVIANIGAAHYADADDLLDRLSARIGTDDPPLAVVLDGVEDPRNLGAIIRTAECVGVHALFIPERRAVGLTETVAKASAGALEYVPVARTVNIVHLIEEMKGRGIWIIGTAADAMQDYSSWDWSMPSALLLGSEGEGLRRLVREHCDSLVSIPVRGRIESLNVSVAAGVVLYEALRQRTIKAEEAYNNRKGKSEVRSQKSE